MHDQSLTFMTFLQQFRRGALILEADEQLTAIVDALAERGGSGELTIKLPVKVNKGGQLEIEPKVTSKLPAKPIGTGIYFATPEGRLTRTDPNQTDIEDIPGVRREAAE